MLRYVLCVYIVFFHFLPGHSQINKGVKNPLALYFGGQYYGENMNGTGYYYFKSDSTFVFIRTGFKQDSNTKPIKDQFNDTLIGYGSGRWFLEDSFFVTKFDTLQDENILQGALKYNAYSRSPYDSLFLKVNLTNYDAISRNIASVTLANRFIGNPAGASGYREIVLPLSYSKHKLIIQKIGYIGRTIVLLPGYNWHEISVTLAPLDNSIIDYVTGTKMRYKFHYEDNEMILDSRLKKQVEGKEKLVLFIKNSFSKFPMQKALLNKILKELE